MANVLFAIVGIDRFDNGNTVYRVLNATVNKKSDKIYDWKFNCMLASEEQILNSLNSGNMWLNAKLDDTKLKIKGSTGSLERFNDTNRPFVILSQIVNDTGKILGYKVANYEGGVRNIVLKEMLAYGTRITKNSGTPVQNAIFIPAELDDKGTIIKAAHYKAYPNCHFIVEMLSSNKNNKADVKRVPVKQNEKTLSKLEEIYNAGQLNELKLGKQAGVDIRIYANPALSMNQMRELRLGLMRKLNVKPIAHPEYGVMEMRYYIICLADGIDIRSFLNPEYSVGQLSELSLAVEEGLDISKMSNTKLTPDEMAEIRERLERKIWKDEFVTKDGSWK